VNIAGWVYTGAFIGYGMQTNKSLTINNCYATGTMSGSDYTGGFIGYDYAYSTNATLTINNSYSAVNVNGSSGGTYTGGLIAYLFNAYSATTIVNIRDTYVSGYVKGNDYVGGFIGMLYTHSNARTYITNCYASGNVTGLASDSDFIGGFIGQNYTRYSTASYSSIDNCYATGNVVGDDYVGGFIGDNYTPDGTPQSYVNNCYATGNVTADSYVGGFIGRDIRTTGTLTVTKSYSKGLVTANTSKGGFIGATSGTVTITDCFYDSTTSGQSDTGKGTPKTTAQMKQQATFTNWDFTNGLWTITETVTYPSLVWQGMVYNASGFIGGTDADYPMLINTPLEIKFMETYCSSYYFGMNGDVSTTSLTLNNNNSLATNGYDLTLTDFVSIASGSTLNATAGADATYITLGGNWTNAGTFTCGTSILTLNGTGAQDINTGGTGTGKQLYRLVVDKSSGTARLVSNGCQLNENFILTAGTFDLNALSLAVGVNYNPVLSSGTTLIIGNGTFGSSSSVGADLVIPAGAIVTLNNGTLGWWTDVTVTDGTLTITGTGLIVAYGDVILTSAGFTPGSVTVRMTYDSNGLININKAIYKLDVGANWGYGASSILQNDLVITTDLNITGGTGSYNSSLNTNGFALTVNGNVNIYDTGGRTGSLIAGGSTITVGGNWTVSGSSTFTANTSNIIFNASGTGKTITSNNSSFYNVNFNNAAGGWTLQDNLSVANDLTLTAGTLNASSRTITVGRHWDSSLGTFAPDTSTVRLTGTGTLKTKGDAGNYFYNLYAAYGSQVTTLSSDVSINNILTLASGGTLSIGSYYIRMYKSDGDPLSLNGATVTNGALAGALLYRPTADISVAGGTFNSYVYYSGRTNS
ncbi:MAG: GLUG motif-containing protein, partial [Candidatus Omnitrophota bacterium]